MKIIKLLSVIIALILNSCGMHSNLSPEGKIEETIRDVFVSLKNLDKAELIGLFAENVSLGVEDFKQNVDDLYQFFQGEIKTYEICDGIGTGEEFEYGKRIIEATATFGIETTTNKYYIALKEVIRDDIDKKNVGILSLYIVDANEWGEFYIYRGDSRWIPGIHIEHY